MSTKQLLSEMAETIEEIVHDHHDRAERLRLNRTALLDTEERLKAAIDHIFNAVKALQREMNLHFERGVKWYDEQIALEEHEDDDELAPDRLTRIADALSTSQDERP